MVEMTLETNDVVIKMNGMNKLWALKSQLTIPYENIQKVVVVDDLKTSDYFKWFTPRAGLSLPGVIGEGTFYTKDGKLFVAIREGGAGLVLQLENESYAEVIIEVENPQTIAQEIQKRINQ